MPWIAPDEMIYGLVGETLWETGQLSIRGIAIPYYSLLTPLLVGLPLTIDDLNTGLEVAQALQALAMSLVAVPVYLWGRRLAGPGWGLAAAALAVLPPALWYGGLLMTEALYYPLVTAALFALTWMLERPTLERQGIFLFVLSLAAAVRMQALILLPVLILAVALDAWFGRSRAIVRRLTPILALVGAATVTLVALSAAGHSDLLGAYGELAETTAASTNALAQLSWHGGAIVVMTLGLPLLATATLAVLAAVRGENDPAVRAFLAVTSAYLAALLVQVSVFAAGYLDHVSERYLATTLPPLFLGLCLWVARGAPRPRVVAVPVAVASVLAVLTLPPSRVGTALSAHDSLTALPFVQIVEPGEVGFRAALAAFAVGAVAVFLLLPRHFLPAAVGAVALGLVVASVLSAREIDRLSGLERAHDIGTASPTWVDEAGVERALLFDTREHPSTAVARMTFWNRSIRRLVRLEDVPPQALPQASVSIRRDGALVDELGREVSAPNVVLAASMAVAGDRIASTQPTEIAPGSGLWRVDEPLRIVSRATGFTPIGDFGRAQVVVYDCGGGALALTLLGKDGFPIRISVNGFPWQTVELAPGGSWSGSVRPSIIAPGIPCIFVLESEGLVGSTRVEWVKNP